MPAAGQSAAPPAQIKDTDQVVHALCGKSIALLGESPVHGFSKTLEFKVELVRRLTSDGAQRGSVEYQGKFHSSSGWPGRPQAVRSSLTLTRQGLAVRRGFLPEIGIGR